MSKLSYRKINFPKINWNRENYKDRAELSPEIYKALKDTLDTITNKKSINPHLIQEGLRSINFHKERPELYKIIEEICLEYDLKGKEMNTTQILTYIINYLSDNKTRKGLNALFDEIKDKRKNEITPKELSKIAEENGEPLDEKDFQYILKTIAGQSNSINITQDEFYYIMTKSPEEAIKIILATKTSKIK